MRGLRRRLFSDTWPRVFDLAWPVIATGSIRTTMRTVDLVVVGLFVGPAAVAAVGIGDVVARVVLQVALGLGAGTIALVSQSYGAGRYADADSTTTQSVVLAVVVGVPMAAVGWAIAPGFFAVLGAAPPVAAAGTIYLRVIILTASFRLLSVIGGRALAGAGDTRTPMAINVVATAVNIALTVVLVVGVGPVPASGVFGAAVGTAVGNVIAGLSFVAVFASGRFRVSVRTDALYRPDIAREIVRIGIPQVVDRNVYALADIPLNGIILLFGTEANAAFQIGRRVQQYARMPNWGFSTASSTLVGNSLGRGEPDRAERNGWGSVTIALSVTTTFAAALFLAAGPVASVFTTDPTTLAIAIEWIRILSIATLFLAVFSVLRGALQGAGDTTWPLYASVLGIGGFTLGFSYVVGVALGVGLVGVFAGMVLDAVVRSAVVAYRFHEGSWRQLDVGSRIQAD